jgi:hypothetical protein
VSGREIGYSRDMRSGTCRVCRHNVILHVTEVADVLGDWADSEVPLGASPPQRAMLPTVAWRIARTQGIGGHARQYVYGLVEAFVCKRCGYTELYTREPDSIPIDGHYVREVRGPEPAGPYR